MADEKIIFSMNGVGKILPHNNRVILKDIYLSFFYGAKIGIVGLNGSHVALVKPTYVTPGHLEYVHNRALIFPAGNEYRRFEVINMHYATQGVDRVTYFEPYYHATLLPDAPRRNYSFDVDHDGRYLIRYNMAEDTDIEADYAFCKAQGYQFEEEGIQEMPEVWEKGVRFFKIMSPSGEPVEFCQIL